MFQATEYRRPFVDACLDAASHDASSWVDQLNGIVAAEIAPCAAYVDRHALNPSDSIGALKRIGAFGVMAPEDVGGSDLVKRWPRSQSKPWPRPALQPRLS